MRSALALSLFAVTASAAASDFNFGPNPLQSDFHSIAQDITAALDYKALGPAEAGGLTGFSVGAFGSYVPVKDKGAWQRSTGQKVNEIGMVGVNATKGLPFDVDISAFYSQVPSTDAKLFGGAVRWAVLPGGIATPAVALRASYTKMSGENDLRFNSKAVDVSISKGFAFLTPYAGAGYVWGTVKTDPRFLLKTEDVNKAKFFVGLRASLGFIEITPEYERVGSNNAYNLRLSLGF